MNKSLELIGTLALGFALAVCGQGRRPVLQAQFCLTPQKGPLELKKVFQQIAHDEGLDYLERGYASSALEKPQEAVVNGSRVLLPQGFEMAVRSKDDQLGFSASVSGAPSNQVMMGFTNAYGDQKLSLAFVKRVVTRLRQNWDVHVVSGEVGMFPLGNCAQAKTKSG